MIHPVILPEDSVSISDNSFNISFAENVFKTNNTFISTTYCIYSSAENISKLKITGNYFLANGSVAPGIIREGIRLQGVGDLSFHFDLGQCYSTNYLLQ